MNERARTANLRGTTEPRRFGSFLVYLVALSLSTLLALGEVLAQDLDIASINIADEICGDGIDDSVSGQTSGSCSAGWATAVYSTGCDFLCSGIDQDQDKFYSTNSGTRTETATANGAQSSVSTITVNSGHAIREGMFVDVASPARRVTAWTSTTITVRGAVVSVTNGQTISAVDALDCDDTNRDIIPGEPYPCDPDGGGAKTATDGYRYCLPTGSYGTCVDKATTPYCPEDPGNNGTCFYLSHAAGNDATGDGSWGNPWKTLGKISGGSTGTEPASPRTIAAGDKFVLLGNTDFSTSFVFGSETIMLDAAGGADGTALSPIIIERDPGATAKIVNADGLGLRFEGIDFVEVRNLEISTNSNGSGTGDCSGFGHGTSISANNANDRTFIRVKLYDSAGCGNDNDSGITCHGTNRCRVHNSFIWDWNYDYGANNENISGIMWLDNDGAGTGAGHMLDATVLGSDARNLTTGPTCAREKHGANQADIGTDGHKIDRSFFINCKDSVRWDGSGLRLTDTVIAGEGQVIFKDNDEPGSLLEDNFVQYNTMLDSGGVSFIPTYDTSTEKLTIDHNVIRDIRTTYSAEGILAMNAYGTGTQLTTFESNALLVESDNFFYNPNRAVSFCYFCVVSGGGADAAGSDYTLTQWIALTPPYGSGDFEKDPNFSAYLVPQDSDGLNKGRRLQTAIGPTPTPTPSPTPTPAPETYSGGGSRAKISRRYE